MVYDADIGCPKKNVPLFHKKVPLLQKRTLCMDTAQQGKQLSKTFLWNKGTFFGQPFMIGRPKKHVFVSKDLLLGQNTMQIVLQ